MRDCVRVAVVTPPLTGRADLRTLRGAYGRARTDRAGAARCRMFINGHV